MVDLAPRVQATLVPVRPWFSLFNAVIYDGSGALRDALPELPRLYGQAGIGGWSVWVPPNDEESAGLLEAQGYREEGSPLVMGAQLASLDLEPRQALDLEPHATWTDIARCNDAAHEVLPEWSMSAVFEEMEDAATRRYAVRVDGQIAGGLLARRHQGDCYFWFVATIPAAQRQGLGAELMRHALREAAGAGCLTASLESTRAGERLYRQLGFQALGRCARWARYGEPPAA